ncbi:hypothetical protein ABZP36_030684 [Zizania latifolia]
MPAAAVTQVTVTPVVVNPTLFVSAILHSFAAYGDRVDPRWLTEIFSGDGLARRCTRAPPPRHPSESKPWWSLVFKAMNMQNIKAVELSLEKRLTMSAEVRLCCVMLRWNS